LIRHYAIDIFDAFAASLLIIFIIYAIERHAAAIIDFRHWLRHYLHIALILAGCFAIFAFDIAAVRYADAISFFTLALLADIFDIDAFITFDAAASWLMIFSLIRFRRFQLSFSHFAELSPLFR
jgi:hypothetical protein